MAKWFGKIGYRSTIETEPGVYETDEYMEREYYGDIISVSRRFQTTSDGTNDDIKISNNLSIVADPFANKNFQDMVYAEYLGVKWKIESVEPKFPRLVLTLGVKFNG